MDVRERLKPMLLVLLAAVVSPGLPPIIAFVLVSGLDIKLPDNFDHQVFLAETAMFYVAALPGFLAVRALRGSALHYALVGMFATWPLWMIMMCFPSDASVSPLNPQFFFAPTTAIFGLVSGLLFFSISRKLNRPQSQQG
jgi:hypothetical protein